MITLVAIITIICYQHAGAYVHHHSTTKLQYSRLLFPKRHEPAETKVPYQLYNQPRSSRSKDSTLLLGAVQTVATADLLEQQFIASNDDDYFMSYTMEQLQRETKAIITASSASTSGGGLTCEQLEKIPFMIFKWPELSGCGVMGEAGEAIWSLWNALISEWELLKNSNNAIKSNMTEEDQQKLCTLEAIMTNVLFAKNVHTWAKSTHVNAAQRAESVLEQMVSHKVKPNVITFNAVIGAYAKSAAIHGQSNAAERADKILQRMELLHTKTGYEELRPDVISYTSVIDAYSKSNIPHAAKRASEILHEMEERYALSGETDANVKPNTITYNSVMNCWNKHQNKADGLMQIEHLFQNMTRLSGVSIDNKCESEQCKGNREDVTPSVITYSIVMSALAKSDDLNGADRACQLLERMIEKGGSSFNTRPNSFSFSAVINGYVKRGQPEKAHEILLKMDDMHERGLVDPGVRPNTIIYTSIIDGYAKVGDSNGLKKAMDLLDLMENRYEQNSACACPTVNTYTCLINGWAKVGIA